MKNIVPCKICLKNFEYIPGPAGNARQFCAQCCKTVSEEELKRLEEKTIIEKNRYLIDAPKRKNEYDPVDILIDGNMPDFTSDADRFVCAVEIAAFLNKQKGGFCGMEDNVARFLEHIGIVHATVCIKQWHVALMQRATKHKAFRKIANIIMKIAV